MTWGEDTQFEQRLLGFSRGYKMKMEVAWRNDRLHHLRRGCVTLGEVAWLIEEFRYLRKGCATCRRGCTMWEEVAWFEEGLLDFSRGYKMKGEVSWRNDRLHHLRRGCVTWRGARVMWFPGKNVKIWSLGSSLSTMRNERFINQTATAFVFQFCRNQVLRLNWDVKLATGSLWISCQPSLFVITVSCPAVSLPT